MSHKTSELNSLWNDLGNGMWIRDLAHEMLGVTIRQVHWEQ